MAKILLIDDDPVLLKLYGTRLTADGHDIQTAIHGEAAIELLTRFSPDLIVLDLLMPKLNGFSFLEQVKAMPQFAHTIKIVFSSVVDQDQLDRLTSLGVAKYLNKTETTPTELVVAIKELLGMSLPYDPARNT